MKNNTLALLLSSALVVPVAAFAADNEPKFYVGGGYTAADFNPDGTSDSADIGVLSLIGGYQINENLAAELRLGAGVSDDDIGDTNIENDYVYGLYLKMGAPTPIGLYPYILAGWTETKFKLDPKDGRNEDQEGGDLTYGVGVDYRFTPELSAGLEYAKYYEKDDYDLSGISLNVTYRF